MLLKRLKFGYVGSQASEGFGMLGAGVESRITMGEKVGLEGLQGSMNLSERETAMTGPSRVSPDCSGSDFQSSSYGSSCNQCAESGGYTKKPN